MPMFRARRWGAGDWTTVLVSGETDNSEDEPSVESALVAIIGSALSTCPLHVQKVNEDGDWEDIE